MPARHHSLYTPPHKPTPITPPPAPTFPPAPAFASVRDPPPAAPALPPFAAGTFPLAGGRCRYTTARSPRIVPSLLSANTPPVKSAVRASSEYTNSRLAPRTTLVLPPTDFAAPILAALPLVPALGFPE